MQNKDPTKLTTGPTNDAAHTDTGSVTKLGQTVNAEVDVIDSGSMNIVLSGAISVDCDAEEYSYDGDKTITVPGADTAGDCVHDALDTYGASLKGITYAAAADEVTVTTKVPIIGTIDMILSHSGISLIYV